MYCIVNANTKLHVCCIISRFISSPNPERETASLHMFAMTSVFRKQRETEPQ